MTEIETDSRGRATIPKRVRERYGTRYRLVELQSCVKLVPIPEDPVESLREAADDDLRDASMEELLDTAEGEARRQAEEDVR